MKLIRETVEEVKVITESKNGVKSLYITGPFLVAEKQNKNKAKTAADYGVNVAYVGVSDVVG